MVGDDDLSLREKPNHDYVFWNSDLGCTVYRQRPRQCRTWPFWHVNVSSRVCWDDAATTCPGMNQGQLFDAGYVERISADDGTLGSARRLRCTQ
jgi:Fe-S-cluster containining protein